MNVEIRRSLNGLAAMECPPPPGIRTAANRQVFNHVSPAPGHHRRCCVRPHRRSNLWAPFPTNHGVPFRGENYAVVSLSAC